jgi:hypothetical protein
MDTPLLVICGLTFVIHVIATLAYAVRIAGVRTRRIAVSFSLFGIIALVSRTANSFQGPFIAKRVELDIAHHMEHGLLGDFRLFLLTATVASTVGAFLIPTFQRYFSRAVDHFQANRSIPRLLLHIFSRGGVSYIRLGARLPSQRHPTGNWRRRFLESYRTERYRDGDLDGRRFRIALCWIPEARFAGYMRESIISYQWLCDRGIGSRHRSASLSDDGRRNRRPDFGKQLPAGNYNSRGRTRSRDTVCAGGARSSGIYHCSHRRTHLARRPILEIAKVSCASDRATRVQQPVSVVRHDRLNR